MNWTADKIALLKVLWPSGLTTAEMGRRLRVSKSAVVGKAHRLRLPGKPSPIRNEEYSAARARAMVKWHAEGRPKRGTPPRPVAPPRQKKDLKQNFPEPVAQPNPAARYIAMGTVHKPCEFLIGERRDFKVCGADRVVGKSFCPDHCAEVYIKIRPRQLTAEAAARIRALEDSASRLLQETEQCL